MWYQKEFKLNAKPRGFHLITDEVYDALSELKKFKIGIAHIHLQHTSAALTINENADPSVRVDFERYFNRLAPEMSFIIPTPTKGQTICQRTSNPAYWASH